MRIGGMTITDDRAALVVLAREGDGNEWRVELATVQPLDWNALTVGGGQQFPIVLDAAAWNCYPLDPDARPSTMLQACGWDARPPAWRKGRAVNPSDMEFSEAWEQLGPWRGLGHNETDDIYRAADLAVWGATHETTAQAPITHDAPVADSGSIAAGDIPRMTAAYACSVSGCGVPFRGMTADEITAHVDSHGRIGPFTVDMTAGKVSAAAEFVEPVHAPQDDALAYLPDAACAECYRTIAAGKGRDEDAGAVLHPRCAAEWFKRQRDAAEAALLELVRLIGPVVGDSPGARAYRYLVGRGLIAKREPNER